MLHLNGTANSGRPWLAADENHAVTLPEKPAVLAICGSNHSICYFPPASSNLTAKDIVCLIFNIVLKHGRWVSNTPVYMRCWVPHLLVSI